MTLVAAKSRVRVRVMAVALVLISAGVLGQVCGHDFTWWDDGGTVHQNPYLNPPSFSNILHYWHATNMSLYIPVTYTVWGALAFVGQVQSHDEIGTTLNPWVFHTANLGVHVLNVILVFVILRKLIAASLQDVKSESGAGDWAAFLGALLFAIHPGQVEAVAWVSGMKDLLCGMFTLIAVWQYVLFVRGEGHRWGHYWIAVAAFVLGMLSKPTGMVAIVLVGVIDYSVMRRRPGEVFKALWVWVVILVPFLILTRYVQPGAGVPTTGLVQRPLIAGDSIGFYLYKLVWPARLAMDYGRTPKFISMNGPRIFGLTIPWIYVSWILPAAVAVWMWRQRRTRPWVVAAGLVFVGGMLPVLGLTPFLFELWSTTADHYLYIPMLGVAMGLAFLLREFWSPGLRYTCAIVLGALAVRSFFQTRHWANDLDLYTHNLQINPDSPPANINLARVLMGMGRTGEAVPYMRHAVEINPDYYLARDNLAMLLASQGDIDGSIEQRKVAMRLRAQLPSGGGERFADDLNTFGETLMQRGRYAEAIEQFEHALKLRPGFSAAEVNIEKARTQLSTQPGTTVR